jgi:hypothetical protein
MTSRELLYVVGTLRRKKRQVESMGPATDDPELARFEVRAIDNAIAVLERPRLPLSPFV